MQICRRQGFVFNLYNPVANYGNGGAKYEGRRTRAGWMAEERKEDATVSYSLPGKFLLTFSTLVSIKNLFALSRLHAPTTRLRRYGGPVGFLGAMGQQGVTASKVSPSFYTFFYFVPYPQLTAQHKIEMQWIRGSGKRKGGEKCTILGLAKQMS